MNSVSRSGNGGWRTFLLFVAILQQNFKVFALVALPLNLQRTMEAGLLTKPSSDVYVLGTVHIGNQSAYEAELLIESVRPSIVVLELAPSRVKRIRLENNSRRKSNIKENKSISQSAKPNLLFQTIPALAERGWESGGFGGLVFTVVIMGGSLIKKSLSANEETEKIPRRDEFAAAVEAADAVNAKVVAADYELEELIEAVSKRMTTHAWLSLAIAALSEKLGLRPPDPILRTKREGMVDWAHRRRNIETARASRFHGEESCIELSNVLVEERDARFADSCINTLKKSNGGTAVCVAGLVHLDGVSQILRLKMNSGWT